jgi:cobalt-zinc-cadmium resistance protein CzcA
VFIKKRRSLYQYFTKLLGGNRDGSHKITLDDGASTIYREGNSRYIAIKYSVRGRDLGSTVRQGIDEVGQKVKLPEGYHLDWTGEYESQQRANRRLAIIVPVTLLLMSFILYSAFGS